MLGVRLSLEEREEIALGIASGRSLLAIPAGSAYPLHLHQVIDVQHLVVGGGGGGGSRHGG